MTFTIKNELIGTWNLLSFIEVPVNGVDSKFPMGKNPKGILIYSPDGYMSIEITNSNPDTNVSGSDQDSSKKEVLSFLNDFITYSGTYKINDAIATVQHVIRSPSSPHIDNELQERKIDFEGDILYLKSVEPILSGNEYVNSYMTWQRVESEEISVSDQKNILESTRLNNENAEFIDKQVL